jgi:putative ABC transport system ATP-binding protein
MKAAADLVLEAVSKHYATAAGLVRAVDEISVSVPAGSSLAIVGPSGCGKSTLLSLIGGLEVPTSGRVALDGQVISGMGESQRARLRRDDVGFVFQADNLLPFLTAVENVGLHLAQRPTGGGYDRCVELLESLGLDGCTDKLPDQLSGGQRQRVAVARALIREPRVILADEPTGSLDADNSHVILDLLLAAQRQTGATLIVVTHDASVARRLSRTLSLRDGRVVGDSGLRPPPPMSLPPPIVCRPGAPAEGKRLGWPALVGGWPPPPVPSWLPPQPARPAPLAWPAPARCWAAPRLAWPVPARLPPPMPPRLLPPPTPPREC